MKTLARTVQNSAILRFDLIAGILIMAAAFLVLPIGIFSIDLELMKDPAIWGIVLTGMLFFGLIGFFGFVRPYFRFRNLPEVQAETDGTYLYLYGLKEAKIPLVEMEGAYLHADVPYRMGREFLVHLLSERYGTVYIEVPKYGKFKLYFIAGAQEVPHRIIALAENKLKSTGGNEYDT